MSPHSTALRLSFVALFMTLLHPYAASAAAVAAVGSGCEFSSLPDVITRIKQRTLVVDEVHLLTSYVSPPIDTTGISVYIGGGFATCDAAAPTPSAVSVISGAGTTRTSVIKVRSNSNNVFLNLHDLEITGSDTANTSGTGNGGGISFEGHGELDLTHVIVDNNAADNGAGIDVHPDGPTTGPLFDGNTIVTLSGSRIQDNRARYDGGGLRVQGTTRLFILKDALSDSMEITRNIAGAEKDGTPSNVNTDHGGGIFADQGASIDISSTSTSLIGVIHHNQATYGAGVAVDHSSNARLFTTKPRELTSIAANQARSLGGGVFVGDFSLLCGWGYSISANSAPSSAAIYEEGYIANLTRSSLGPNNNDPLSSSCGHESAFDNFGAVDPAIPNQVDYNTATDDAGSVIHGGDMRFDYVTLVGNTGGNLLSTFFAGRAAKLFLCLITNNTSRQDLMILGGDTSIDSCTVTGNSIGGQNVLFGYESNTLKHSIFWQLGKTTLHLSEGSYNISDIIANDADAYTSNASNVSTSDPLFVQPERGNYRLRFDSPAVDFATTGGNVDLDNHSRGVVLKNAAVRFDIGAYERQTGNPRVTFPFDENFDELTGPEQAQGIIPPGWNTEASGNGALWGTTSAWVMGISGPGVGESILETPTFIVGANATLTFRQTRDLGEEANREGRDGAVLEISIDNSAFVDILAAGGNFVSGGYNGAISSMSNPLNGRAAWTGDGVDWENVKVNLPSSAAGKNIFLRWRIGTDSAGFSDGYILDDIHVDPGSSNDSIFANDFEVQA